MTQHLAWKSAFFALLVISLAMFEIMHSKLYTAKVIVVEQDKHISHLEQELLEIEELLAIYSDVRVAKDLL